MAYQTPTQKAEYHIKEGLKSLAKETPSREVSLAKTKLQEAGFWLSQPVPALELPRDENGR